MYEFFGKNDSYDLIEVDQTFVLSSDYTKAWAGLKI